MENKHAILLADAGCTILLVSSEMLLTLLLDVEEEFQPLVNKEDLIGLCVEVYSIVGIGCMQAVTMGSSLMQGSVHADEAGG